MSYINVGAKLRDGTNVPTKKALRDALSQDLASVTFYNTSPMGPAFRGHVGNLADEATVLTICGPDPYNRRNWWSNIKIKDGKVIMDDKPIKAVVRERETVWCEKHGGYDFPHFQTSTCLHPHFTDQATRARMNAEATNWASS